MQDFTFKLQRLQCWFTIIVESLFSSRQKLTFFTNDMFKVLTFSDEVDSNLRRHRSSRRSNYAYRLNASGNRK